MIKYEPVRDVIDDLLATTPIEALNRLAPPSEATAEDDPAPLTRAQLFGFMSKEDLRELAKAHRADIENGRPDDGVLYEALFHRHRQKHLRAGASDEVAEQRAREEALEEIRKLEQYVEEELKKLGEQRPPIKPRQPQPYPEVGFELMRILDKGWREGYVDLYVRQDAMLNRPRLSRPRARSTSSPGKMPIGAPSFR